MAKRKDNAGRTAQTPRAEAPSGIVEWADLRSSTRPLCDNSSLQEAQDLVQRLRRHEEAFLDLARITEHVNRGTTLDEVLDILYEEAKSVIPYDRIGFSLIDRSRGVAVARWARSERELLLANGYEAPLGRLDVARDHRHGQAPHHQRFGGLSPRKPTSQNTKLIVREGIRSSLTCPLIVQGVPVGFLFFSSVHKNTYSNVHVAFFQQIASQLATIVEKGRLYSELAEQKAIIEKQNRAMAHDLDMARQVQQALIPQPISGLGGHRNRLRLRAGDPSGRRYSGHRSAGRRPGAVLRRRRDGARRAGGPGDVDRQDGVACGASIRSAPRGRAGPRQPHARPILERPFRHGRLLSVRSGLAAGPVCRGRPCRPAVVPAATGEVLQQGSPSLPLGIADGTQYAAASLELEAGDALVFSTDGIIEAFDPQGVQYGVERLRASVLRHGRQNAQELCAGIQHDQAMHCKDCVREDDLTLLVVKAVATA